MRSNKMSDAKETSDQLTFSYAFNAMLRGLLGRMNGKIAIFGGYVRKHIIPCFIEGRDPFDTVIPETVTDIDLFIEEGTRIRDIIEFIEDMRFSTNRIKSTNTEEYNGMGVCFMESYDVVDRCANVSMKIDIVIHTDTLRLDSDISALCYYQGQIQHILSLWEPRKASKNNALVFKLMNRCNDQLLELKKPYRRDLVPKILERACKYIDEGFIVENLAFADPDFLAVLSFKEQYCKYCEKSCKFYIVVKNSQRVMCTKCIKKNIDIRGPNDDGNPLINNALMTFTDPHDGRMYKFYKD